MLGPDGINYYNLGRLSKNIYGMLFYNKPVPSEVYRKLPPPHLNTQKSTYTLGGLIR